MDPLFIPDQSKKVRVILNTDAKNEADDRPAPEFNAEMNYVHTGRNRPIRFYHAIDQRFILEDFFAKLARWYRKT
jgi:hypothetical protein